MLERKNQTGGDGSINIQSENDVNLNVGITYSEARQIALDVFESNFVKLSKNAAELAYSRTQELTEKYLKKLYDVNPALLNSTEDPDMQYALFTAQKEYARTGDKALADLLVDILVDRASQNERSVLQIVNNEALSVAPKLTLEQYNVLSLVFIIRYTKRLNLKNFDDFVHYIKNSIRPLLSEIRTDDACFQHLEYTGCGSLQSLATAQLEGVLKANYPGLFWRGAQQEEIDELASQGLIFPELVIPCINDVQKLQFNALNEDTLNKKCKSVDFDDQQIKRLVDFQNSHLMNDDELQQKISSVIPDFLNFLKIWNKTSISNFTLTSVGIAIGYANIRRLTKENYNIGIWVK